MSADNIAVCPKCNEEQCGTQNPWNTLREYYGITIKIDGKFVIEYQCICHECGFEFKYDYEQQVYTPKVIYNKD